MKRADIYVRDHLLIQFMLKERYLCGYTESAVEAVYKEWQKWLKEQEEKHAEGSKI